MTWDWEFYVYILTNSTRSTLYLGVTNNLRRRILEHYLDRGNPKHFSSKYSCYYLLYYEEFVYIDKAIKREKEIKKWNRKKKEDLIKTKNPEFRFLNVDLFGEWPTPQCVPGQNGSNY